MTVVTMRELLEAGVHFGHQTRRWNPKMKPFIFQERNGIYIIDLALTVQRLRETYDVVKQLAREGRVILFVGTKKQAQDVIREEAERAGTFYVNQRWLGGTLTNFATIQKRISRLRKLENMKLQGDFERLPKKEVAKLQDEMNRLERFLGGIKDMHRLPDAIFVVDPKKERIAVLEARKLKNTDHRGDRYKLRSRRNRLPDSGKRRRDTSGQADGRQDCRRDHRGQDRDRERVRRGRLRGVAARIGGGGPVDHGRGPPLISYQPKPEEIKALREETSAPMMDCRKALVDAAGDVERAKAILLERGAAQAAKKAGRTADEGLVTSYIHAGGKIGVLVEVNSETDFVARNPKFVELSRDIAMHIAAMAPQHLDRESVPPDVVERLRAEFRAGVPPKSHRRSANESSKES